MSVAASAYAVRVARPCACYGERADRTGRCACAGRCDDAERHPAGQHQQACGLKMRVGMKTVSASGTVTIALLVAVSLFRDSTFFATRTPLSRLLVSGGTGI